MNLLKKIKQEEHGSATIEFLGVVPLVFIVLAIFIQFIVGVNGVLMAQSAANESASVYSVTEKSKEAKSSASDIIDSTGDHVRYSETDIIRPENSRDFSVEVSVRIRLIFLPEKIRGYTIPSIPFTAKATGRVIK